MAVVGERWSHWPPCEQTKCSTYQCIIDLPQVKLVSHDQGVCTGRRPRPVYKRCFSVSYPQSQGIACLLQMDRVSVIFDLDY